MDCKGKGTLWRRETITGKETEVLEGTRVLHRWEKTHLLTFDSFKPYLFLSSVDTLTSGAARASLEYGVLTLEKEDNCGLF